MVVLFVCTLFLSSTLLFLVQPMIAKMILPLLGGTPAVWNTCMVFFQATLLLAYLYVHAITRWLRVRQQALLHAALLMASVFALPIAIAAHDDPPATGTPILWLARVLVVSVGVPFFVVSTSGPLLQRWFARSDHPAAQDPYFLSVAGNLGSIAALVAYPAGVEPALRLADQSGLWAVVYTFFVLFMLVCVWMAWRSVATNHAVDPNHAVVASQIPSPESQITTTMRLRWLALAFVPSSMMLGLTTYLTTDVAPIPLFWVVPLTVYLASFALVFARRTIVPHALMVRLLPILALVLVTMLVFAGYLPPWIQAPLHLVTFFVAAMVCHGELARSRPQGTQLTTFYLLMSTGGVLGGVFNALIAPVAFRTVVEYPLAIVLACAARPSLPPSLAGSSDELLRGRLRSAVANRLLDVSLPFVVGGLLLAALTAFGGRRTTDPVVFATIFLAPALVCFSFKRRPLRFALTLGALMVASDVYLHAHQAIVMQGRSYFSVYKIVVDPERRLRLLVHGRINHGAQSLDPERRREPLTYYHRTGPIGQAFAAFAGPFAKPRVAIVGLGAGAMAVYAQRGQSWTFYEIDPAIIALARDPKYFTFLSDAPVGIRVVPGDARLSLAREAPRSADLLVIDAFGSDAIPIHLLTREALALYIRNLEEHGVLALHVSNRYLDLQPLLGDLAGDARLAALAQSDANVSQAEFLAGKTPSSWVLMARSRDDFGPLVNDARWHALGPRPKPLVWTDDFSNPLSVMRWF